jgi:hypothetical protein
MLDPRQVAERIVGNVQWESEVSGYCKCPGEALHTSHNGRRDCRVNVDGAPTIFCFHASCVAVVSEANKRLRRELGSSPWELRLPDGQVLRSGDVMKCGMENGERKTEIVRREPDYFTRRRGDAEERLIFETLRVNAARFRPELFEFFRWPMAQILEDSPLLVAERDAEEQFRTWLKLWPGCSTVWIGDVYSSGRPEHRTHFRSVAEWYQIGPVMGNFTCGSAFKAGSWRRSNENLSGHRFLVVESDVLSRDEVGAIFAYLQRRLRYRLHCIIDTAGKSLHGWFDAPPNRVWENRLRVGLEVFGCDPKVFTYSQPVRVPGAWREGKLQRLVWLRE